MTYPATPAGWTVVGRRTSGPFTTAVTFDRPDGHRIVWTSRWHRKHASRLSTLRLRHESIWWAPHRASWWISVLFVVGSTCFLVAPLPWFVRLVGADTDGVVFFVGSIFFTAAATLQWLEAINADREPGGRLGGATKPRFRVLAWEPRRIDYWSSGSQLVGTLFFNATTFRALTTALDDPTYDKAVWRPDFYGSVCFLVSGYLAYVEVTHGWLRRPAWTLEGSVASVNLLGCVAFGLAALAAYVLPSTGDELNLTVANGTTSVGALAFLVGAVLMLPEGAKVGD